jgi:nucleoside-diphosphate-sugar epimerase
MNVLITGAKGFVGQEIAMQCEKNGIKVLGVDIIDDDACNYHKVDVMSNRIKEIIPEECDAIIHLAALSRDRDCKNNAYKCFNVNVMGTLNLMEAAQQKGVKNFIFASTEWVYDSFLEYEIKDEDSFIDIAKHKSEYALSKLVSEVNLRQKYQNGFCNVTILRFGIIYGPRKSNWSAVESIFHAVNTKEVVEVGSLRTGRCFIHVADIANGVIKSIGLTGFNLINLQGDHLITLREIIEVSKKITGKTPSLVEKSPENISLRNISNNKARTFLNWVPKYDLEKGLSSLIGTVI